MPGRVDEACHLRTNPNPNPNPDPASRGAVDGAQHRLPFVEEQAGQAARAAAGAEEAEEAEKAEEAAGGTGGGHAVFVVLGCVTVAAPYNAGSCRSTNTIVLTQVQRLLERA